MCDPGPCRLPRHGGGKKIGVLNCDSLSDWSPHSEIGLSALPSRLAMPSLFRVHTHKQEHKYMVRECIVE